MNDKVMVADSNMNTTDLVMDAAAMQQMVNVANLMSQSKVTVPRHLQGSKSDCLAVVMQAAQWRMNPFAVAQKTHLVNGNLGYEAQLINAVISSSQAIIGRFKYEYADWDNGNGKVRCGAILAGDKKITWGEWLDTNNVTIRNSPLWKTNPRQQSAYLSVKYWSRLYCPDVILGIYSVDEYEDFGQQGKDITPATEQPTKPTQSKSDGLLNKLQQAESNVIEIEPEQPAANDDIVQLQVVLDQINWAENEAQLKEVAVLATDLPEEDQAKARKAYKNKRADLEAALDE